MIHHLLSGLFTIAGLAAALAEFIRANVPTGATLVVGGDFNARRTDEACFGRLAGIEVRDFRIP